MIIHYKCSPKYHLDLRIYESRAEWKCGWYEHLVDDDHLGGSLGARVGDLTPSCIVNSRLSRVLTLSKVASAVLKEGSSEDYNVSDTFSTCLPSTFSTFCNIHRSETFCTKRILHWCYVIIHSDVGESNANVKKYLFRKKGKMIRRGLSQTC